MAPLRGWAPRGQRFKAKVPHGDWKTMTFLAALRHDRVDSMADNRGSHKGKAVRRAIRSGRQAVLAAQILARPEPHPRSSSQSSSIGCARLAGEQSRPSVTPSAKSSAPSLQPNAEITSPRQGMRQPNSFRSSAALGKAAGKQDPRSLWLGKLRQRRHPNVAAVALANKNARIGWANALGAAHSKSPHRR